jgi:BirA family transcriptional regulator, biotin operon repressor / biotin---[acetyl-CoA-carboxylase] ligase
MHWIIERHDVIGSTMDAAEERAQRGAPSGVVVVAGEQTSGRGQRGRQWLAPAGTSLLMTALARPVCPPNELTGLPVVVGTHVSRAVERIADLKVEIKPPNDLLVDGRKIAGILCQSLIEGTQVRHLLIGIGLNVNIDRDDVPLPTATSLQIETGKRWDLNEVLEIVLNELEQCWCFSESAAGFEQASGGSTSSAPVLRTEQTD